MDSINATIRPATPDDVPAILGLIRELAEYEKLTDACTATEDLLRRHLFGEAGGDKAADALVAIKNQQTVGYAIYFKTFSTFLAKPGIYLEDLYVQPAHRNRGIGKSMFRYLAQLAIDTGCERLEWTCLDWNAPSLAFYKSLGAAMLPEWKIHRLTGPGIAGLARPDGKQRG
jgi:GNAT superfamily N-acetyltransferase